MRVFVALEAFEDVERRLVAVGGGQRGRMVRAHPAAAHDRDGPVGRHPRAQLVEERRAGAPTTEAWETANLHTVATTLVGHATLREETRGGHWREDHPDRDDLRWRGHLVSVLDTDGNLHTRFEELP